MKRLSRAGQVALVTGASRGIGAAFAEELSRRGMRVALAGRDQEALRRVADLLPTPGMTFVADLAIEAERRRLVADVEDRLGPVAVLVNNAGIGVYGAVEELSAEALRQVLELNVVAPVELLRLVLPAMSARGTGEVVQVSSVLGRRAMPMSGGYCASKFALEALSQSARVELRDRGVRILVVRPGRTESDFRRAAISLSGWRPEDRLRPMAAEVVARRSLDALEAGRSEIDFTAAGRMMLALERWSPSLNDRIMVRLFRRWSRSKLPRN